MNWYYVENAQQAGPVSEAQFAELCRSGKVQDDTLVWREGMPDWQPWGKVRMAGAPPAFGAAGGVVCAGCGKSFRPEEVIQVADRFVCATCKPEYLQRVREGVSGAGFAGSSAGPASLETVAERDYEHDLGDYLNRGWEFFKNDPGIIIGTSVLVYLCMMACSFVPYLGYVLQYVFYGPLIGGLWRFYLKKQRGGAAMLGDGFSGFGPDFGKLLLAFLIPALLTAVCMVPGGIPLALGFAMPAIQHSGGNPFDSTIGIVLICAGGSLLLAGMCVAIYLSTCWAFTLPLVADKGMTFWPAMSLSRQVVIKHWWMTFVVVLVIRLLGSVGALACCVGVLVTAPVAFASYAYAYERLFGDLAQQG